MSMFDRDTLRVDVPVGFLLPEPREITVSVDRPAEGPLSIQLRLVPAQVASLAAEGREGGTSPIRPQRTARLLDKEADFAEKEYGCGD